MAFHGGEEPLDDAQKWRELSPGEKRRLANHRYYMNKKKAKRGELRQDERKVPIHARLPEWMVGRLQRIAAEGMVTGKYPVKTMTEALIWLLTKAMKDMKDDPVLGEKMRFAEARMQIDNIRQTRREVMGLLHTAIEEVGQLLNVGAAREAGQYFYTAIQAMRELPPTAWSDDAIKKFKQKFPELAKQKPMGVDTGRGHEDKRKAGKKK